MYDLMQGVRVVEVAEHTFAPAAGMVLADWGADVIKIERADGIGDAARAMRQLWQPGQTRNGFFESANRGKRSVALDLTRPTGQSQLYRLIDTCDVFITNLRSEARAKLGIEADVLMGRRSDLIYARATAYGMHGPMAGDGGFDFASSWCRAGAGFRQTPPDGSRPPRQPGAVGDLTGGAALAGAISAALFRRERIGKGAIVDHSLYGMGAYIMIQALASESLAQGSADSGERRASHAVVDNPLNRLYQTRDRRWLSLCLLQDRWFPDLARRLERPDMISDPRFATEEAKYANAPALVAELDQVFVSRTLAEWTARLTGMQGVWAPLQSPAEVLADPQALANGFVTPVTDPEGAGYLSACTPGQFDERPVGELRASPNYGEHTFEVMSELGLSPSELERLRAQGTIWQRGSATLHDG